MIKEAFDEGKKLINKLATLPASIYRRVPVRRGR